MAKAGSAGAWERVDPPHFGMRWRVKPHFYSKVTAALDTDDGRMGWLLKLAAADLGSATNEQWFELWLQAVAIAGNVRGYSHRPFTKVNEDHRALFRTAQLELVRLFTAVINGSRYVYTWGGREGTLGTVEVVANFTVQRTESGLRRSFDGPLPLLLLVGATDTLERLGVHRLRQCPLRETPTGAECGRLFIATRRQRFCSRQHATRAAWLAWVERHHGGAHAQETKPGRRKAR